MAKSPSQNRFILALDIGSNSVGSMWHDRKSGQLTAGTSIFPAGVVESDEKRGDPKNVERRNARRTRITLARRSQRKRELRVCLIENGLLPKTETEFMKFLENTNPWDLRRRGLDESLSPYEFGRVLLHLSQRRGALGLKMSDDEDDGTSDDGKVKASIREVERDMKARGVRTFGEFMAMLYEQGVHAIGTPDQRDPAKRRGEREYHDAIRNTAGSYKHCADRAMIRNEFLLLWDTQKRLGGKTAQILTDDLRSTLDNETGDSTWRHTGLLFGQRRATWDLGTLGRCVLEPSERCVPHADMYASHYRVVEQVNNLKIIQRDQDTRTLTPEERSKIIAYLSGPLGMETPRKKKGQKETPAPRPKQSVSVTDLRNFMGSSKEGWGRATKTSRFRFNIENDEDRTINTDWFNREIVHGAIGAGAWEGMPDSLKNGINRAILKCDPDLDEDADKLRLGILDWGGLNQEQADALVAAWKRRPRVDSKRLNMSRRAVRNVLEVMDREEPWPVPDAPGKTRWLTQIEARKMIAEDSDFLDVTTGKPLDVFARKRYATGVKGLNAKDRHFLRKHGGELPPAPMISNPVVRKAIHEVRRHVMEYMHKFGKKPDEVYIELAREAKMGAKDSDRYLFRNRLRNRIQNDIAQRFNLDSQTSSQQRMAMHRVVLCVQQGGICPLCGKGGLTDRKAASGIDCEVAHIIPRASGGHNGFANIVLSHTACNRVMGRRTPREFWSDGEGFEKGMQWVEGIYNDVKRPTYAAAKNATGVPLWMLYFDRRDDRHKIERFKKDVKDIKEMTLGQGAATQYASRQVMTYLADALFDGEGLPERGGERKIFATKGIWTHRFRREWGLFFDPHDARSKGLSNEEEHERKEKNRADHRHHVVDAVIIGLTTRSIQMKWDEREKQADREGINTADDAEMECYRRAHPIDPPLPFKSREELRQAVERAVFGEGDLELPICHRPVKRKLIGALHEGSHFGPILDREGNTTEDFVARKGILSLTPNHLRMPVLEKKQDAIERLANRRSRQQVDIDQRSVRKWAKQVVESPGYQAKEVDPPAAKSGIIRDIALRARLRECLEEAGLDPDDFKKSDVDKLFKNGQFKHASGVPIRSFRLLRTMNDPVIVNRKRPDYRTTQMVPDQNPTSKRAYLGGNQHHIEIRVNPKGKWSGDIVTAFIAANRKLDKLRAFREAGIPKPKQFRNLPKEERRKLRPILSRIERNYPIVDRTNNVDKGGEFIMSLCEGETLFMKHKKTQELGYFVVAKLDKPQSIVVVPHWDARAAGERKNSEGKKVPNSKREQFAVTPSDLKALAPPDHEHAVKVHVTPLGKIKILHRD
tara:strand:+ start:5415 stop:9401 length:3987 start_codon:yes stop_codon:yes gene_type:complete